MIPTKAPEKQLVGRVALPTLSAALVSLAPGMPVVFLASREDS